MSRRILIIGASVADYSGGFYGGWIKFEILAPLKSLPGSMRR